MRLNRADRAAAGDGGCDTDQSENTTARQGGNSPTPTALAPAGSRRFLRDSRAGLDKETPRRIKNDAGPTKTRIQHSLIPPTRDH